MDRIKLVLMALVLLVGGCATVAPVDTVNKIVASAMISFKNVVTAATDLYDAGILKQGTAEFAAVQKLIARGASTLDDLRLARDLQDLAMAKVTAQNMQRVIIELRTLLIKIEENNKNVNSGSDQSVRRSNDDSGGYVCIPTYDYGVKRLACSGII